jgi:FPC/CPF motif-containing protein YcgG
MPDLRHGTLSVDPREDTVPSWAHGVHERFVRELDSSRAPFPCTFAVSALQRQGLRFAFAEHPDDEESRERIRDALARYIECYRNIGRITSLVVFFRPAHATMPDYERSFWSLLQYLIDSDAHPWPETIPRDPEDPYWEFCFNSEPIFVVCSTPAHSVRKSRCSEGMTITFQPPQATRHLRRRNRFAAPGRLRQPDEPRVVSVFPQRHE